MSRWKRPVVLIAVFGLTACGLPPHTASPSAEPTPEAPRRLDAPPQSALPQPAPTARSRAEKVAIAPAPLDRLSDHELIPFVSDREARGVGRFDVFLYDRTAQAVLALPAANSPGDEFNPSLTHNNRWLVFVTNFAGNDDIVLLDLETQLVNTLPNLNTPADEFTPTIDSNGTTIAYVSNQTGTDRLHLYDLRTQINWVPAAVARLDAPVFNPFLSSDGTLVVFSSPVESRKRDLFFYELRTAAVRQVPFINTEDVEDEPVLSPDNRRLVLSTDREGETDVLLLDLDSGFIDHLQLLDSPVAELSPTFLGKHADQIVFVSDQGGEAGRQMFIYRIGAAQLDTVPVSHVYGRTDTFGPP